MFTLLNIIVASVLILLALISGYSFAALEDPSQIGSLLGGGVLTIVLLLAALWVLAIIIPSIAVAVRRLHDRNLSGWWYLGVAIGSLIPFVGLIVSIAFLVVMVLPGTPGPNRFGPDPKDPAQVSVFE